MTLTAMVSRKGPAAPTETAPSILYSQARLRPVQSRSQDDNTRRKPVTLPPRTHVSTPASSFASISPSSYAGYGEANGNEAPEREGLVGPYEQMAAYGDTSEGSTDGDESSGDESEEYVVALHDFTSNNGTCLSFVSGQVIKVFNRDESGWWDGELDGQRGWFPSNYVDEGESSNDHSVVSSVAPDADEQAGVSYGRLSHDYQGDDGAPSDTPWTMPFQYHGQFSGGETPASSSSQHTATYASTHAACARQPAQLAQVDVGPQIYKVGGSQSSRSPTPIASALAQQPALSQRSAGLAKGGLDQDARLPSVLEPIKHAISLLHNAVRANRIAHFQPSTACVISSVRSVLSSTDCLTRESSVLKAHPILAKERKQILAELSKLVTQARRASTPTNDNDAQYVEMEAMLRMADQVLFNVRRFLDVAVECDVPIPDGRTALFDDVNAEEEHITRSSIAASSRHNNGNVHNRVDLDKTPTPDSPRSSTYRTAFTSDHVSPRSSRSYADLRVSSANHHHGEFAPRDGGFVITQAARIKAQALDRTRAESSSPEMHASKHDSISTTEEAETGSTDSASSSLESPIPAVPKECAPGEILERTQHANDHLLSIIAAFIGHIHSHTRESHASSYAFLIDMTRATVDGVRTLLVIVETVHACQALRDSFPRQTSILWETRESVYEATAALVTAARIITSTAQQDDSVTSKSSPTVNSDEDDDNSKLLQAATAVLRTGGECVGAVKLCLNRADPALRITLAMPPSMLASQRSNESVSEPLNAPTIDEEDEEAGERHLEEAGSARRAKHTLSYLGRKATSLSCLRERYDSDTGKSAPSTQFEDIAESSGEAASPTDEDAAVKIAPLTVDASGDSSDSSEPMSREHSRASASTLHSARSNTTPNTSARPSMDRGDTSGSVVLHQYKHVQDDLSTPSSAPILGSFPRHEKKMSAVSAASIPHIRNRSVSLHRPDEQQQQTATAPPSPSTPGSPAFPSPPRATGLPLSSDTRILAPDFEPSEVCFNSEGQLTGATLKALVEKMTPHNTTIDATLSNAFFLCFRLFTSPLELFEVLESRYSMRAPPEIELNADDFTRWIELKVKPVQLRVFNFLKLWLENHWNAATDFCILDRLIVFTETTMTHSLHRPGQRLADLAHKRHGEGPNARMLTMALTANANGASLTRGSGTLKRVVSAEGVPSAMLGMTDISNLYTPLSMSRNGPTPPQPIVSRSVMGQLKQGSTAKVNVMDFDPLELARQLTIMESRIFCAILPEELLGQEFSKKAGVSSAVNVKRMSALSTHITGWASECILGEEDARKRTQWIKFFLKLGDRCLALSNFNALFALQGALNSSTISRLKRTWDGLSAKYRQMMEQQRHVVEHTRNFAIYRQRLRTTLAPALPFVGLFLTDLTFCHEGNAATRTSPGEPSKRLLNFDKYVKMSRIIGDLQRFQVPYALMEVPEMQAYLRTMLESAAAGSSAITAEELYRRSLRLEPRSNTSGTLHNNDLNSTHTSLGGTISARTGLSSVGMDIFNWK